MKKLISFPIIFSLIASMFVLPHITVSADWNNDDDVMMLLSELNIMVGDSDGDYHLDDAVSRQEFAKIAVASSAYKDSVAVGLAMSPYTDVPGSSWAAPYISECSTAGYVKGYLDGTFHPGDMVSYEEAVTIMLRVLGYSDSKFGVSYPYGQISCANSLELNKNVSANIGDDLSRRQVARLVYNSLNAKMGSTTSTSSSSNSSSSNYNSDSSSATNATGSSSSTGTSTSSKSSTTASDSSAYSGSSTTSSSVQTSQGSKLITVHNCTITEDVTLIASSNEDITLPSDKIYTTSGKYYIRDSFDKSHVGQKGDIVVKDSDTIICFVPTYNYTENDYTVTDTIGTDLVADGNIPDINSTTTVYYKTNSYYYSGIVSKASKGDIFKTYSNANGGIEYAMLVEGTHRNNDMLDKYIVYSVLGNDIICYKDGAQTTITLSSTTTCYKDNVTYSYSSMKSEMEMGDILYVKYDGTKIDYVSYSKGNMEGPVQIYTDTAVTNYIKDSATQVMRDGNKTTSSAIQINDIIYYSPELDMILAYSNKVTGIYQDATPSRDDPQKVKISGTVYSVEGSNAYNALSSSGSFKLGDTITVCLGKDGDVAGVVSAETTTATTTKTGYAIASGKKDFTNSDDTTYSSYYLDIVGADGKTYEYATKNNYSTYVPAVVKATFANGTATVTKLTASGSKAVGTVDSDKMLLGSTKMSDDIKILDVVTGISDDDTPLYAAVYPQRLNGLTLKSSDIFYTGYDSSGAINELILANVTNDAFSYGIITQHSKSGSSSNATYTTKADIDGDVYSVSSSSISTGAPCRAILSASSKSITKVYGLLKYSGSISKLTTTNATISSNDYQLSDKVIVYEQTDISSYRKISLNSAISGSYSMIAYYDRPETSGGRIRVIIATAK